MSEAVQYYRKVAEPWPSCANFLRRQGDVVTVGIRNYLDNCSSVFWYLPGATGISWYQKVCRLCAAHPNFTWISDEHLLRVSVLQCIDLLNSLKPVTQIRATSSRRIPPSRDGKWTFTDLFYDSSKSSFIPFQKVPNVGRAQDFRTHGGSPRPSRGSESELGIQ